MIFEDKFTRCIEKFNNINKPDYTKSDINLYADFVELISLFAKQDGVTLGDIQKRFFGEKDYDNINEDYIVEKYVDGVIFDEEYYENANENCIAGKKDVDEVFLKEIFMRIEERITLYKGDYPFEYIRQEILTLKKDLTDKNKLYISLLISSILNIFESFENDLTTDFEKISYEVLKNFLPERAIVREFGKNTQYKGTVVKKIMELATNLNLSVNEYELKQIPKGNNQDGGLDIVGWLPFDDLCGNTIIFLCQCACGKKYEDKQHDVRKFDNYLVFYKTYPQYTLFIPYSLINIRDKKFYHSNVIEKDYLIFERKRIIEYFKCSEKLESFKIVDSIINLSSNPVLSS